MYKIFKILAISAILILACQFLSAGVVNAVDLESLNKLHESNHCKNFLWEKCDLSNAQLNNTNLREANLVQANLSRADLSGTDLGKADLSFANLRGANLAGANLSGTDLVGTDLTGANLVGSHFGDTDLSLANLSGANLSGLDLTFAVIHSTNFSETNLNGVNLEKTECGGHGIGYSCSVVRQLVEGNFTKANFSNAKLVGVDFGASKLKEANFTNAILRDTSFGERATFGLRLGETIMPDGTVLPTINKSWYEYILSDKTEYDDYAKKMDNERDYYYSSCRQDVENDQIKKDLKYKGTDIKYSMVISCQEYRNSKGAYEAIKGEWKEMNTGIYENIRGYYEFVIQD